MIWVQLLGWTHFYFVMLMQYKFYVDGEWRHDEHQPFLTGNYGLVNTIYIPEANPLAALPIPGTPNIRMGMDVDNDTFQHAVSLHIGNFFFSHAMALSLQGWDMFDNIAAIIFIVNL